MKLDYKRTFKVGIAFLIIMLFWEVYDFAIPLILDGTYGLTASARGLIMGLDNLLAIFLLPLFGALSDRSKGRKFGRRTPFILIGTIISVIMLLALMGVQLYQFNILKESGIMEAETLVSKGYLDASFLLPEYSQALPNTPEYYLYSTELLKAQNLMAKNYTALNPTGFILFVVVLFVLLISMSSFRSPAVALMPDVTVKPLRSSANAIINFMGGAGAFLAVILYTLTVKNGSYSLLFIILAIFMVIALIFYCILVKENKFVKLRNSEQLNWGVEDFEEAHAKERLSKSKKISLILILACVFFWFMGYNAVKSHLSVYGTTILNMTTSEIGIINIANGLGGAIALIPVAFLAKKLGRKKSVLIGLIVAAVAFIPCALVGYSVRGLLGVFFVVAGFGLIIVNVNTLPMVVEMSKGANVGRFTGFYYVATMTAQAITPYFAGLLMDNISTDSLFYYAAACIAVSFIIMLFVKHGDTKPNKEEIKENLFDN